MKKLIVILAAVASVGVASASELYWLADATDYGSATIAKLYATAAGVNYGGTQVSEVNLTDLSVLGADVADISSYNSAYSFYVELWDSTARVATSKTGMVGDWGVGTVSYGTLDAAGAIRAGSMSPYSVTPYSFSSFSAQVVPEPTSGLLLLIGFAGLALRRKRLA